MERLGSQKGLGFYLHPRLFVVTHLDELLTLRNTCTHTQTDAHTHNRETFLHPDKIQLLIFCVKAEDAQQRLFEEVMSEALFAYTICEGLWIRLT